MSIAVNGGCSTPLHLHSAHVRGRLKDNSTASTCMNELSMQAEKMSAKSCSKGTKNAVAPVQCPHQYSYQYRHKARVTPCSRISMCCRRLVANVGEEQLQRKSKKANPSFDELP